MIIHRKAAYVRLNNILMIHQLLQMFHEQALNGRGLRCAVSGAILHKSKQVKIQYFIITT